MCKINGCEIRTAEFNGELWFALQDVADAVGYSMVGVSKMTHRIRRLNAGLIKTAIFAEGGRGRDQSNPRRISAKLSPESVKCGLNMTNREGLVICSARSAGAPGHCSKVKEWQLFLQELDKWLESQGYSKVKQVEPVQNVEKEEYSPSSDALDTLVDELQEAIGVRQDVLTRIEKLRSENRLLKQKLDAFGYEHRRLQRENQILMNRLTSINEALKGAVA